MLVELNPLLRKLTTPCLPLMAVAGTILASVAPAQAQQGPVRWYDSVRQPLSDWKVVAGGGAILAPAFEGSDELEISPIPTSLPRSAS